MSDLDRVAREILAQQRAERDDLGEALLNALRNNMPWGLTVDLGNGRSAKLMRMNGREDGSRPYRPSVSPDGADPAGGESPVALRDWQIVFDWKLENCDQDHIEMTVHITGGGGFV